MEIKNTVSSYFNVYKDDIFLNTYLCVCTCSRCEYFPFSFYLEYPKSSVLSTLYKKPNTSTVSNELTNMQDQLFIVKIMLYNKPPNQNGLKQNDVTVSPGTVGRNGSYYNLGNFC